MIKSFLKYRKQATNAHGIHSPFVFEFYNEVIKKSKFVDTAKVELLRKKLVKDKSLIEIVDLGAGSRISNAPSKSVADLVKTAAVSKKYGQLIARVVDFYSIKNCLEMGTSMGLGTAYLSLNSDHVLSIEGCPNTYEAAKNNLSGFDEGIELINYEFTEGLEQAFNNHKDFGLIYIDGNHQYQATLDYFHKLIDKVSNDTMLIFDDINWSTGMRKAWDEIIKSDKINVSIELFRMGIVIKRKEQTKQHFVLKF